MAGDFEVDRKEGGILGNGRVFLARWVYWIGWRVGGSGGLPNFHEDGVEGGSDLFLFAFAARSSLGSTSRSRLVSRLRDWLRDWLRGRRADLLRCFCRRDGYRFDVRCRTSQ